MRSARHNASVTVRSPRSRAARTTLLAVAAVMCTVAAGCGSSPSSSTAASTPSTTPVASSFTTVADLATALNDRGVTCKLSYAGLKDDATRSELSICTIDNEQATLRVWQDPADVTKFLASPDGQTGLVAVGPNWMISFETPATAAKIATVLGGTAPGANAAATTLKP